MSLENDYSAQNRTAKEIKTFMYEKVKKDLKAHLGEQWDAETEDFDPLVELLITAFAGEYKEILYFLDQSEQRILDKLLDHVFPDYRNISTPAHTIIQVRPTLKLFSLKENHSFDLSIENVDDSAYFSPLFPATLINGKVGFIASDSWLFIPSEKENGPEKIPIRNVPDDICSRLTIGLFLDKSLKHLTELLLYFQLTDQANNWDEEALWEILTKSDWKLNGNIVAVDQLKKNDSSNLFKEELQTTSQIEANILKRYKKNFFALKSDISSLGDGFDSSEVVLQNSDLNPFLTDPARTIILEKIQNAEDRLVVIDIRLRRKMNIEDITNRLSFHINAFPIINRQLRRPKAEESYFNRTSIKAIKIEPDGDFWGIHRVFNAEDQQEYHFRPHSSFSLKSNDTFTLFKAWERSDDNISWKGILYLLSILRRERKEKDLRDILEKKISIDEFIRIINELSSSAAFSIQKSDIYVVLNSKEEEQVIVEYWTTQGKLLEGVHSTEDLVFQVTASNLIEDSIVVLSPLIKGKDKKQDDTDISYLREKILSGGRVVTFQDIKNVCLLELESYNLPNVDLQDIKVERAVDKDPIFDLCRVIAVNIAVEKVFHTNENLISAITKRLLDELTARSSFFLPFRIYITEKQSAENA